MLFVCLILVPYCMASLRQRLQDIRIEGARGSCVRLLSRVSTAKCEKEQLKDTKDGIIACLQFAHDGVGRIENGATQIPEAIDKEFKIEENKELICLLILNHLTKKDKDEISDEEIPSFAMNTLLKAVSTVNSEEQSSARTMIGYIARIFGLDDEVIYYLAMYLNIQRIKEIVTTYVPVAALLFIIGRCRNVFLSILHYVPLVILTVFEIIGLFPFLKGYSLIMKIARFVGLTGSVISAAFTHDPDNGTDKIEKVRRYLRGKSGK